jgi:DNA-binding phage protein
MEIHLDHSERPATQRLIDAVLDFARERGIDQATLAKHAGIAPEALSRLKKAGNCRLATALGLARAAGLTHIILSADPVAAIAPADHAAATVCARKLSAGRRIPIAADELVAALRADEIPARHRAHLFGFFEELPIGAVHEVILDEGLDFPHLAAAASRLGAEGKTVEWIEDMAGDGVATAA